MSATPDHSWVHPPAAAVRDAVGRALAEDLTPLGEGPGEFTANTRRLRREFAHLREDAWDARRLAFLGRMAEVPQRFRTRLLAAQFDSRARANLARTLQEWPGLT